MLPAVRADGPLRPRHIVEFTPEAQRPVDEILEQLEELYDAEGRFSCYSDLLEAVRQVFLGFCVQRSRLRATARAWQEALHDVLGGLEDATVLWTAWHSRIAAMLVDVDFVTWLVPEDSVDGAAFSTFRDGSVKLSWLLYSSVQLPVYSPGDATTLIFIAAQPKLASRPLARGARWIGHSQCSQQPSKLDFVSWAQLGSSAIIGLSLLGLIRTLSVPEPVKNFRRIEPCLRRLRLFADLVRGVAFLWAHGVKAFPVAEPVACPGLAAVRQLAVHTAQEGSSDILSNFPDPLSCFTHNYCTT